jgi:hypothetical protein
VELDELVLSKVKVHLHLVVDWWDPAACQEVG